jgi:hypothetical protein
MFCSPYTAQTCCIVISPHFTGYCYGVVSYKASHAMRPFLICCAFPIWVLIFLTHPPELSGSNHQKPSSKAGINLATNGREFCRRSISVILRRDLLSRRKISRHRTNGFTSRPKEVVLMILSPLKAHRPRPGLNPGILGPMLSTITTTSPRPISPLLLSGLPSIDSNYYSDDGCFLGCCVV